MASINKRDLEKIRTNMHLFKSLSENHLSKISLFNIWKFKPVDQLGQLSKKCTCMNQAHIIQKE